MERNLVATSVDAVSSSVADRFLVSHYHVVGPGVPRFMIQLVDPESRIRTDVFPDLGGSIADAKTPMERIFGLVGWHRRPNILLQSTAAGAIMSRRG